MSYIGLYFKTDFKLNLACFTDLNWGSWPLTWRSTTDFNLFLGDKLVCWKSKKQLVVSRSSSKADYHALANTSCEEQWLLFLLQNFGIYCENRSVIHIATISAFHEGTKHIEMESRLARDKIQSKTIHVMLINSDNQVAGLFTKSHHIALFSNLFSKWKCWTYILILGGVLLKFMYFIYFQA